MSEIKAYALVVPTDEVYESWMGNKEVEYILSDLNCIGIHPEGDRQYLLFKSKEDRIDAYNKICNVLPETKCGFELRVLYVDKRYLEKRS